MAKSPIDKAGVKHCHPGVTTLVHGTGKVVLELKLGKETVLLKKPIRGVPISPENITV